jgi:hypothetical protein
MTAASLILQKINPKTYPFRHLNSTEKEFLWQQRQQ